MGQPSGDSSSREYNDNIRLRTMQWAMIDVIKNPPVHFAEIVREHFRLHASNILVETQKWCQEASYHRASEYMRAFDELKVLLLPMLPPSEAVKFQSA
jgi:hypothetical protein